MAKPIVLTQNDKGVEILCSFYDGDGNIFSLKNKTINVTIIAPDKITKLELQGVPTVNEGEASIILDKKHTEQVGTYSTYWQVITPNGEVTAQQGLYYSTIAEFGGAII